MISWIYLLIRQCDCKIKEGDFFSLWVMGEKWSNYNVVHKKKGKINGSIWASECLIPALINLIFMNTQKNKIKRKIVIIMSHLLVESVCEIIAWLVACNSKNWKSVVWKSIKSNDIYQINVGTKREKCPLFFGSMKFILVWVLAFWVPECG